MLLQEIKLRDEDTISSYQFMLLPFLGMKFKLNKVGEDDQITSHN